MTGGTQMKRSGYRHFAGLAVLIAGLAGSALPASAATGAALEALPLPKVPPPLD